MVRAKPSILRESRPGNTALRLFLVQALGIFQPQKGAIATMTADTTKRNRLIIYALAVLLGLLHQDLWFWNDRTLVGGWLPIGLGYHALYSVAAGLLWAAAVKFAWPAELEAWASGAAASPTSEAADVG